MENETIIAVERKLDHIRLDGKFNYGAYVSIGLMASGDFYLKIEFAGLTEEKFFELHNLYKLDRPIEIRSALISKEAYDITHIIIEKFEGSNKFDLTFECLSDKPGPSLII